MAGGRTSSKLRDGFSFDHGAQFMRIKPQDEEEDTDTDNEFESGTQMLQLLKQLGHAGACSTAILLPFCATPFQCKEPH